MKPKHPFVLVAILILCILIFGFTFKFSSDSKAMISWSERALNWEDFEEVNTMEEDYVALIYSDIKCPDLIIDSNSKVYAFMNPNRSERLRDEYDSYNVLVHEQYHFNIAEYCARLLRKDIVKLGLGGLSLQTIKSLKIKYSKKLDSLQTVYDSITDHNSNFDLQRYWELQIDDWLRQTASYQNEDIYSYYNFTKNPTHFFKEIYFTHTQKVLTSYPIGQKDMGFGAVYEIDYPSYKEKETVVKFYKDGKLTNGGYFETAITKITEKEEGVFEVHYYSADEQYNTEKTACIRSITVDKNKNKVAHFFNAKVERAYRNEVYEIRYAYNPDEKSYYTTYYDKGGKKIANKEGVFHEKRTLDEKERTIVLENFDKRHRPKNDDAHIARYETAFSQDHMSLFKRMYDENGDFALYLSDYHLAYEYDELGRRTKVTSLDGNGDRTYDHNGASIYEYTYDLHDRQTSLKRFNREHEPIVANDDYFQKIMTYDPKGRKIFEADYYPGYVLRFSDKKDGASKVSYEIDTIRKTYNIDAYNNVFNNNFNVAITAQTLNSQKQVTEETYFDANENYAKTDDGAVMYRYKYDSRGNQIETAVYDSIDNPREFEADVAIIRWVYDASGNKIKTTYYTKNNELAIANDSITYNLYAYNEQNELYERKNYNKEMKPAEIAGVYKSIIYSNKAGLDSLTLDYDSQNRLKEGVAITKYFYNKYGNKIRVAYYDRSYQRTRNENGLSAIKYTYNKRQLLVGFEYLDEFNRPTNNRNGAAFEKWELNDLGHTLTYGYYDKNRSPVIGEYGYHKVDYEWGPVGQSTKSTTYGADLKLINDEYGTAIYSYTLAPSGMIQTIERYNAAGVLANNSGNVAVTHYESRLNGLYYIEKEVDAMGEVVNDTIIE